MVRFSILLMCLCAIPLAGCRTTRTTQQVACQAVHRADHQVVECPAVENRYGYSTASVEVIGPRTLDDCVSVGLAQNPSIKAIRYDIAAIGNRVTQASSLPDAMVGSMVQLAPVQTAAGEQRFALSVNQKFITGYKLDAKATAIAHEKKATEAKLAATELEIAEKIQISYFRLYYVQQAIEITTEDQKQLKLIGEVVARMYRVKRDISQQDVLNVDIEQDKVETELISLEKQKRFAQARLARLMHLSPDTRIEVVDNLPMANLPEDIHTLYAQAIEARPELHEQIAKINRDKSLIRLAERQSIPDVTLGANWIGTTSAGISPVANGDDAFILMASLNLPRQPRIAAAIREANNRACAERTRFEALKDSTLESVTQFFTDFEGQKQTLDILHIEIIPKAELTLDESFDAYEVGEVDIMQLVQNWRKLLSFQLAEKRLETELRKTIASLGRIIGNHNLNLSGIAPSDLVKEDLGGEESDSDEEEEGDSSDSTESEADYSNEEADELDSNVPDEADDGKPSPDVEDSGTLNSTRRLRHNLSSIR